MLSQTREEIVPEAVVTEQGIYIGNSTWKTECGRTTETLRATWTSQHTPALTL